MRSYNNLMVEPAQLTHPLCLLFPHLDQVPNIKILVLGEDDLAKKIISDLQSVGLSNISNDSSIKADLTISTGDLPDKLVETPYLHASIDSSQPFLFADYGREYVA